MSFPNKVLRFETLDSTNAEARRQLAQGRAAGFAVISDHQSRGRGRRGRAWLSPKGSGIYLSLTCAGIHPIAEQSFVSIVAGVAVGEWLEGYGLLVGLKWPNDLRVDGAKLGGILCERQDSDLVIGVGVNWTASPGDLDQETTSVEEQVGQPCSRDEAAALLIDHLVLALGQWRSTGRADLAGRWWRLAEKRRSYVYEGVQVRPLGLNDQGEFLVQMENGSRRAIACGELEDLTQ